MSNRSAAERLASLNGAGPTTQELVSMVRDDRSVIGEAALPERGRLDLEATGIRRERTGVHATITVSIEGAHLADDLLNVEKDAQRTRLANSAGATLGEVKRWGQPIKLRLNEFCRRLWGVWIDSQIGERIAGDVRQRPEWLLEPYILADKGTILFGPPGACKSYIGLLWALGLSYGVGPWRHRQARTLFVNLERDLGSLRWRVACVGNALGIRDPHLLMVQRKGGTLADVSDAVDATIKRNGVEVVIVDSMSRAGGGNLNDNEPANATMDRLNAFGVSWVILAHVGWESDLHPFGSRMQEAAADYTVRQTYVQDFEQRRTGVMLAGVKCNDRRPAPAQTFTLEFSDEDDLTNFRAAEPGEWPDLEVRGQSQDKRLADALRSLVTATPAQLSELLGIPSDQVRVILNRSPRFVAVTPGSGTRPTIWGLAAALGVTEPLSVTASG